MSGRSHRNFDPRNSHLLVPVYQNNFQKSSENRKKSKLNLLTFRLRSWYNDSSGFEFLQIPDWQAQSPSWTPVLSFPLPFKVVL